MDGSNLWLLFEKLRWQRAHNILRVSQESLSYAYVGCGLARGLICSILQRYEVVRIRKKRVVAIKKTPSES